MGRDRRIDTIRGLLIAIMIIDHVGGYLKIFTWQPFGYVSAAEGFVFLSGFICAKVYGKYSYDYKLLIKKTFGRSLVIYKYHISLALVFIMLAFIVPKYQGTLEKIFYLLKDNPVKTVILYIFLLHQPDYLSILPMYSILLLLCPIFLLLIYHGRAGFALTMSFFIWIIGQYIDPLQYISSLFGPYYKTLFFNIFSWQFLFVIGLYLASSSTYLDNLCNNKIAFSVILSVCLIFLCFRHSSLIINNELLNDRGAVPVHRLVNFCFLMMVFRHYLKKLPRTSSIPYLEYMGRNSLQIFSLHIVMHYILYPFEWRADKFWGEPGLTAYSILVVVVITSTFFVFKKYFQPLLSRYILPVPLIR